MPTNHVNHLRDAHQAALLEDGCLRLCWPIDGHDEADGEPVEIPAGARVLDVDRDEGDGLYLILRVDRVKGCRGGPFVVRVKDLDDRDLCTEEEWTPAALVMGGAS